MSPRRLLLALFVVAGIGGVILLPAPVHAELPALVRPVIAQTLPWHTVFLSTGANIVQIDTHAEIVTVDSQRTGRYHWDGATLWHTADASSAPVEVPLAGAAVRDLWDEWRSGFAHTQFVPASPHLTRPDMRLSAASNDFHYFEVVLPFSWARPWLVYLRVDDGAGGFALTIIDRATDTYVADKPPCGEPRFRPNGSMVLEDWLCLQDRQVRRAQVWRDASFGFDHWDLDVPLSPETYSPQWPNEVPRSPWYVDGGVHQPENPMFDLWHEAQQHVRLEPFEWNDAKGPVINGTCTKKGQLMTEHGSVGFAFPSDPARAALLRQAAVDCPNPRFVFSAKAVLKPSPGMTACAKATFRIVSTRSGVETTLAQQQVNQCQQGPVDDERPFVVDLPMPRDLDPVGLEVRVESDAELRCQAAGSEEGIAGFLYDRAPRFEWPGCYPGWEP